MRQQIFFLFIILINCIHIFRNGFYSDLRNFYESNKSNQTKSVSYLTSHPRKIFFCTNNNGNGRREMKKILSSVFNEYTIEFLMEKRTPPYFYSLNYTHENNIFVDTYSFQSCTQEWMKWLLLYFDGKFLFFSPESPKSLPYNNKLSERKRIHNLGPIKASKNDVIVTYMQAVWWDKLQEILPIHYMINKRFVNEKEIRSRKFLIYANSNCVNFREDAIAKLSHLDVIDCNGKCQGDPRTKNKKNINNTRGTSKIGVGNWWENSILYKQYKFCFVMEHEKNHPTYITEKILLAFSAGKSFNIFFDHISTYFSSNIVAHF